MTTTVTALAQDIGLARETDYFLMKDQLTEDELGLLYKVRKFAETEVLPVVNPYWERAGRVPVRAGSQARRAEHRRRHHGGLRHDADVGRRRRLADL